jgi:hypothetical protein
MKLQSNALLNTTLSVLLQEYFLNPEYYIGLKIAPLFRTAEQTANYPVFGKENLLRIPSLRPRAPGTPFPRSSYTLSADKFSCANFGHETPVADEERKMYDKYIKADAVAVKRNARIIVHNHERRVRDLLHSATIPHATAPTAWDDPASDPVEDVRAIRAAIRAACGIEPNTLTLTRETLDKLATHPQIRAINPTFNGPITEEMVRTALAIKTLLIADAPEALTPEGQPVTVGNLWGANAYFTVTNPGEDLQAPNALRTFLWTAESGGGEAGSYVETYRDDTIKADVHRSYHWTGEKVTGPELVYRLESVLT